MAAPFYPKWCATLKARVGGVLFIEELMDNIIIAMAITMFMIWLPGFILCLQVRKKIVESEPAIAEKYNLASKPDFEGAHPFGFFILKNQYKELERPELLIKCALIRKIMFTFLLAWIAFFIIMVIYNLQRI